MYIIYICLWLYVCECNCFQLFLFNLIQIKILQYKYVFPLNFKLVFYVIKDDFIIIVLYKIYSWLSNSDYLKVNGNYFSIDLKS
jgi:hypothetical protein